MNIWQAVILGGVQGFTEFLPISSSGHLIFIPRIFGWADQGLAFDVVAHLGTFAAVVVYFRKKIMTLIRGFYTDDADNANKKLAWYIILSVIPAGLVGFLLGSRIEAYTRSAAVVAWSLIGWGIVLGIANYFSRKHKNPPPLPSTQNLRSASALWHRQNRRAGKTQKHLFNLSWREALFIACAQAVALIPGTSRSGITMTAGLFSRLDKKSAAEFSFLMAIPVIALAGMYEMIQIVRNNVVIEQSDNLTIGFLAAALSGMLAIHLLMKIITRWSFMPFVVYRVAVGLAILLFLR